MPTVDFNLYQDEREEGASPSPKHGTGRQIYPVSRRALYSTQHLSCAVHEGSNPCGFAIAEGYYTRECRKAVCEARVEHLHGRYLPLRLRVLGGKAASPTSPQGSRYHGPSPSARTLRDLRHDIRLFAASQYNAGYSGSSKSPGSGTVLMRLISGETENDGLANRERGPG